MTPYNIIWLDTVDSTNSEAKRRIGDLSHMSIIAAREQTAGRGQRGNTWLSAADMNLTFSIIVKYDEGFVDITPNKQFAINDIVSKTIIEFLRRHSIDARIKLPNDIYVADRKICGILIEHSVLGSSLVHSIIGIGLNVNQTIFDESLPNPTSMVLEKGKGLDDLQSLLEELLDIFLKKLSKRFLGYIFYKG